MGEVVDRYTIEKVAEATNLSDLLDRNKNQNR